MRCSFTYFLIRSSTAGAQYLSSREIEKLDNCSATFLMGCSSGSLWLKGCYIPQGIPLSYLLAGSPAIVANLWDVTDRDIDRFGKALLEAWLRERSDSPSPFSSEGGCSQCESLTNELAAMNLKGNTTKRTRKPSSRNKPAQSNADGSGKMECNHNHGRKIGSFIAAAREVCTLPYLIGAAPVCYGVPTGITRKKGLEALIPSSSSS